MKFLVVLCSALACAVASPGLVGINGAYGYGYSALSPLAGSYAYSSSPLAYSAGPLAYSAGPVSYSTGPVAYSTGPVAYASAPVAYSAAPASVAVAAAPVAVAAPAVVKSQYHAQDELGQASYGHNEPLQNHHASQDAHGNKVGTFSHVAPNGQVFRTDYVADALGYRVASNALPVGPSALPVPVADTAEVVAARANHLAEHVAAIHRVRRGIVALGHTPAATAPLAYAAHAAPLAYAAHAAPLAYASHAAPFAYASHAAPFAYSGVASPLAYAAPATIAREGILTQVVNTPGHAVSYRID